MYCANDVKVTYDVMVPICIASNTFQ